MLDAIGTLSLCLFLFLSVVVATCCHGVCVIVVVVGDWSLVTTMTVRDDVCDVMRRSVVCFSTECDSRLDDIICGIVDIVILLLASSIDFTVTTYINITFTTDRLLLRSNRLIILNFSFTSVVLLFLFSIIILISKR